MTVRLRGWEMDRELVTRAQSGDVDAFAMLTAGATDRWYAVARLILRDDELAADALQDAFLQAWIDLRALRDPTRFEPWFQRLLVRACFRASARRRRRAVVELGTGSTVQQSMPDTQQSIALSDQLERGFARLSRDQRAVLVLRHYLDLSLLEIAGVLGVPRGTVQSRLTRATQAMRAAIEADERQSDLTAEGAR